MSILSAMNALLIGANTNAGSAVFLQRAQASAPGANIPMPHIWYEVTENNPASPYRFNGGSVAVGGSTQYGRNLRTALVTVTAVAKTLTPAHTVIEQLRPKLDGWRGTAGGTVVHGIFITGGRPDYSQPDEIGSEQLDLEVWYAI